ncbi:MAG: hypothetical protein Q4B01_00595 [Eubacteriales bacterium]|nr:hypothetical protein [Eubacteriales bacterium]
MRLRNCRKWFGLVLLSVMLLIPAGVKADWVRINETGDMHYVDEDGTVLTNQWIGNRHVNADGLMDRNKFLTKTVKRVSKRVFVGDDGVIISNFKKGWYKIGNDYYFYNAKGKKLRNRFVKYKGSRYYVDEQGRRVTGLQEIKDQLYYFDNDGVRQTGWQTVDGKTYYFLPTTGAAVQNQIYKMPSNKKSYGFDSDGVKITGWYEFNDHAYYFNDNMKTGWVTIDNKTYYLIKSSKKKGQRAEGIYSVAGKLYYFDTKTGQMLVNTTVEHKGRKYIISAAGVCTVVPDSDAPSDKMLFFLTFESGSQAYNQTGGDYGSACGAYQFDYRYALLPFVKYAYASNPAVCPEFKTYAAYTSGLKLKSNTKFYKAWHAIYKRNPKTFSAMQDTFAKVNYYDNVETKLFNLGVDLTERSDVVKGAVFSYSIQHGQNSAVSVIQSLKVKSSMSDAKLLKKLYKKRKAAFPAYASRYNQELQLALSLLK